MQKITLTLALLLTGCGSLWHTTTPEEFASMQNQEQEEQISKIIGLTAINSIYMGDFGGAYKLNLVRNDIINSLKARPARFKVAESLNDADAEMTVIKPDTSYPVVNLRDIKKDKVIWNFECQSEAILWSSLQKLGCHSSEILEKLFEDAQKADEFKSMGSKSMGSDSIDPVLQ